MWNAVFLKEKINLTGNMNWVRAEFERYNDGEVAVNISGLRATDGALVFYDNSEDVFSLIFLLDAIRRSCAGKIYLIAPYLPYSRQDRATAEVTAIGAKVIASMIDKMVDRIWTVDLHAKQIQGFYNAPLIDISPAKLIAQDLSAQDLVLVSPDAGGLSRTRAVASYLDAEVILINKIRKKAGESSALGLVGEVAGKNCVIIDDIIDGGGTIKNAASLLKKHGAKKVLAYVTHPVLSGNAQESLFDSDLDGLTVMNTVYKTKINKKINLIAVDELILEHIGSFL